MGGPVCLESFLGKEHDCYVLLRRLEVIEAPN